MPKPAQPAPRAPLNAIQQKLLESEIIEGIRQVYDPELPINVYDLGLIYDVIVRPDSSVEVIMTLTSPACPVAGSLPGEVELAVRNVPGVASAVVQLTWDPPFTVDMLSEEAKLVLGLM